MEMWPNFKDKKDAQGHRKHFKVMLAGGLVLPFVLSLFFSPFASVFATFVLGSVAIFGKEAKDSGKLEFLGFKETSGWSWQDIVAGYMGLMPAILAVTAVLATV